MKHRLVVALLLCWFGLSAQASDTVVQFPVSDTLLGANLDGMSISDFTFTGEWRNFNGEGPSIYEYANQHSLTYDLGSFTFKSMQLSGWPMTDAGGILGVPATGSFTLHFNFLDGFGGVIKTDSQVLSHDNALISFADLVSGIHSIQFLPTGIGNYPRLESLTISTVPEPGTYLMLLTGVALIAFRARHGFLNPDGRVST